MHCIVVRRGEFEQYDRLYRAFGQRMPVIWDRRRSASPKANGNGVQGRDERRKTTPASWVSLGFVVVDRTAA